MAAVPAATTAVDLRDAAGQVRTRGHTTGRFADPATGRVCIEGALRYAVAGTCREESISREEWHRLHTALTEIGTYLASAGSDCVDAVEWNDFEASGAEQVAELLEAVADELTAYPAPDASTILVIGDWDSWCGACGHEADLAERRHETVLGVGYPAGERGCGAVFTHVVGDIAGRAPAEHIANMRPDLTFLPFLVDHKKLPFRAGAFAAAEARVGWDPAAALDVYETAARTGEES